MTRKTKLKWRILYANRPPKLDKKVLFPDLPNILRQMVNIYETAGDLTIDLSKSKGENGNYFPTYFKPQIGKVVFRRRPFVKPV